MPRVEEWLGYAQPDVLCLQETKMSDAAFPHMAFAALGYESVHHGSGQWNGVAILSKVGLDEPVLGFVEPIESDRDTRVVSALCGGVHVTSVYVPNGREVDSEHYNYKLEWMGKLEAHLSVLGGPDIAMAVCGDFNIAPADIDVWDPAVFAGATHVTPRERESLSALESWGMVDAFRSVYPQEKLYSYWDYRDGAFHQHRGMRIDLILVTAPLVDRLAWALVDRNARKGKQPSDHAPVFVDLAD